MSTLNQGFVVPNNTTVVSNNTSNLGGMNMNRLNGVATYAGLTEGFWCKNKINMI